MTVYAVPDPLKVTHGEHPFRFRCFSGCALRRQHWTHVEPANVATDGRHPAMVTNRLGATRLATARRTTNRRGHLARDEVRGSIRFNFGECLRLPVRMNVRFDQARQRFSSVFAIRPMHREGFNLFCDRLPARAFLRSLGLFQ